MKRRSSLCFTGCFLWQEKRGGCEAVERWAEERGEKMRWGEVKRMQQGSSAIQKKNRLKYAYISLFVCCITKCS